MMYKPLMPVRALYIWALLIVSIMLVAFAWFTIHYFLSILQPICIGVAENMGSNSTTYDTVNTFIGHLDNWLGVIGLIAVIIGAYQYSQKRGRPVYGY